jgi:hypothetical protein
MDIFNANSDSLGTTKKHFFCTWLLALLLCSPDSHFLAMLHASSQQLHSGTVRGRKDPEKKTKTRMMQDPENQVLVNLSLVTGIPLGSGDPCHTSFG